LRDRQDITKQHERPTPEEKVAILRWHLLDKVPVSTVCQQAALRPSHFQQWHKQFLGNAAAGSQRGCCKRLDQAQQRIAAPQRNPKARTKPRQEWWTGRSP